MSSDSPAPAMSRVEVSLIGAGAWARTAHLAGIVGRSDVSFASVFDPDHERAGATAEEFGFAHVASSLEELLDRSPDACIIASPAAHHAAQTMAAIDAGCHVLLEKPMTNGADEAWSIAELARSRDRHVMLALGWNYSFLFAEATRVLAEDPIGVLEHVVTHMASSTHELLTGDSSNSSGREDRPALSSTWTDPALSGGGYGNAQLSHALGVMFGLVDAEIDSVAAVVRPGPIPGIELSVAAVGKLGTGATLTVSGTSIRPPIRQQLEVRLFGSEGQLHVDFLRDRIVRTDASGRETATVLAEGAGAYPGTAPANAFIDLVSGLSSLNASSAIVGARSTEVLDAVRAAA